MSKEKGFSFVFIPSRGSSKSIHITYNWFYLVIVVLIFIVILANQFTNKYMAYAKEYATITSFSVEEKQQLMAEELFSIQQEKIKISEIIEKIKEKLNYISTLDKEVRESLGLKAKELKVETFFKDVGKNSRYFATSEFSLPAVLTLEKDAVNANLKADDQTKNLEIGKASSDEYKTYKAQTPEGWPIPGYISPGFGWRIHPIFRIPDYHTGVDISQSTGYPIKATAEGIVNQSEWSGGYGYMVKIYHRDGIETLYAHCNTLLVKAGDYVKKGQTIATVGDTGTATNAHVHYEIRMGGKAIDPEGF